MSVAIDVAVETGRLAISRALAADAARAVLRDQRVRDAVLSITFVRDATIARLNREHLGRRGTTDVIAFGFAPPPLGGPVVGDIYIAPAVARLAARERDILLREELVRLVVHGTLHVLGHDHPDDASRVRSPMWKRQERLVTRIQRAHGL
ncbi:MAG TPA: rRNA maturation RNase YbeY [Gemmatimonadaceae bacterium]|nr:rRNA maturation RNase YbeY [Gemmatimonadaceae bacterium]